jgi:hypothetical protein
MHTTTNAVPALVWWRRLDAVVRTSRLRSFADPRIIRAWSSYAAYRLGAVGVVGVVLALAAMAMTAVSWSVVRPQLAAADLGNARLRAQVAQGKLSSPSPSKPHEGLLASLSAREDAARFVEAVQAQAAKHGVSVQRTEYRHPDAADPQVSRLQIVLPARADYASLKQWLTAVLAAYPSCSLDELSLQQLSAASSKAADRGRNLLDARVVLSLYMRGAP